MSARPEDVLAAARLLRDGAARTRAALGAHLGLRSTSVSDVVAHLVDAGLVAETRMRASGRGRPAGALNFAPGRGGGVFLTVLGRTLVGCAVDLRGDVIWRGCATPPRNADNDAMAAELRSLASHAASAAPVAPAFVVSALPGLLDVPEMVWAVSSRWPRVSRLPILAALDGLSGERILVRTLDAALEGVVSRERRAGETMLLLHWGEGIGAAFFDGERVLNRDVGRFCEIGHWRLGDVGGRPCSCGGVDCLETVAALWALKPDLEQTLGAPLDDVPDFTGSASAALEACAPFAKALEDVLRVTGNLCRMFFPHRVLLAGPFVQAPQVFARFQQAITDAALSDFVGKTTVSRLSSIAQDEMAGALRRPVDDALRAAACGRMQSA